MSKSTFDFPFRTDCKLAHYDRLRSHPVLYPELPCPRCRRPDRLRAWPARRARTFDCRAQTTRRCAQLRLWSKDLNDRWDKLRKADPEAAMPDNFKATCKLKYKQQTFEVNNV